MAAFDDGTPLDAAALQDLDRRLTEVKSSIPKIGTTTINNNTVVQEVKQKQIFGGLATLNGKLVAGKSIDFSITFNGAADTQPTAVVLTPASSTALANITFYISSITTKGCSGKAYVPKGDKPPSSLNVYYMVFC